MAGFSKNSASGFPVPRGLIYSIDLQIKDNTCCGLSMFSPGESRAGDVESRKPKTESGTRNRRQRTGQCRARSAIHVEPNLHNPAYGCIQLHMAAYRCMNLHIPFRWMRWRNLLFQCRLRQPHRCFQCSLMHTKIETRRNRRRARGFA